MRKPLDRHDAGGGLGTSQRKVSRLGSARFVQQARPDTSPQLNGSGIKEPPQRRQQSEEVIAPELVFYDSGPSAPSGGTIVRAAGSRRRPYNTFAITDRANIETAALLLIVGAAVTEVALWGRRQQARASREQDYLGDVLSTVRPPPATPLAAL